MVTGTFYLNILIKMSFVTIDKPLYLFTPIFDNLKSKKLELTSIAYSILDKLKENNN